MKFRGVRAVAAACLLATLVNVAGAQTGGGDIPGDLGSTPSTGTSPTGAARPGDRSLSGTSVSEELAQGGSLAGVGRVSLPGPIDPATYRIGPGDVLQLLLWGRVSRSMMLEVGPEGHILMPGAGTLQAAGMTLADLRRDVIERMKKEFRGVSMDLKLVRPRTFRVYVTGAVKGPGPLDVLGGQRVGDVLNANEILDTGSRRRIEVQHTSGAIEYADLDLFLRTGDALANPMLVDGDILNIPVATDFVYAAGALAASGRFELGRKDSLMTLFRLAGDPVPAADAERALLVRFTRPFQPESLWFGLADVYGHRFNPELREGDRLYVYYIPQYHLQHEVSILGEVARPGVYPVSEGRTHLSDLISAAGGFLPAADLSAIRVNRRPPGTERDPEFDRLLRLSRNELTATEYEVLRTRLAAMREDFRVDWSRLMANKQELDLLLRNADIVRVERLVSSIRIEGEVRRPGILAFKPGLTVKDYVDQSGGFTNRAWTSRIRVTRSVTGQTLLAKNTPVLDPGDIIWIPEKPDSRLSQNFQTFLLFAAQVATIVLAVTAINN